MTIRAATSEGATIPSVAAGSSCTYTVEMGEFAPTVVVTCSVRTRVRLTAQENPDWKPITMLLDPYSRFEVVAPGGQGYKLEVTNMDVFGAADVHVVVARDKGW